MSFSSRRLSLAVIAAALALSGCAAIERADPEVAAVEVAAAPPPPREVEPRTVLLPGGRRPAGPPDLRDKAVWAACRPQVIAERCLAFDPTDDAVADSFRGWRRRNADGLERLYAYIASRGGLFRGDIDRTPLSTHRGGAQSRADVTHQNVMIRYCQNTALFFDGDPESNLTFPTVAEIAEQAGPSRAPAAQVRAVRAACEVDPGGL